MPHTIPYSKSSTCPHLEKQKERKRRHRSSIPLPLLQKKTSFLNKNCSFVMLGKEPLADNTSEGLEPWLLLMVTVGSLARLTRAPKATFCSGQQAQRTAHTSRMQKRARQVGQGTRLASQVSGRCGSWRLANHLPMQVRHHMGRQ